MPCECRQIAVVSADSASATCFLKQLLLAAQPAHALREIALVAVVGVGILAVTRTEAPLAT